MVRFSAGESGIPDTAPAPAEDRLQRSCFDHRGFGIFRLFAVGQAEESGENVKNQPGAAYRNNRS